MWLDLLRSRGQLTGEFIEPEMVLKSCNPQDHGDKQGGGSQPSPPLYTGAVQIPGIQTSLHGLPILVPIGHVELIGHLSTDELVQVRSILFVA